MSATFSLQTFRPMTHFNPWAGIWVAPRRTLRAVLDSNPTYWVWPLAILGGVVQVMQNAMVASLGERFGFGAVMLLILLGGGLLGVLTLYVFSALLALTGRLVEGQGSPRELRAAVAWSNVPLGIELIAFLVLLPGLWDTAFTAQPPDTRLELVSLGIVGLARMIGGVWSLALLVLCIAEAQRFVVWRAIANLLMVMILYLVLGFVLFPAVMALVVLLAGYLGYAA